MKAKAPANRTSPTAVTTAKILNQRCIFEVVGFMLQVALVRGGFHASLRKLAFSVWREAGLLSAVLAPARAARRFQRAGSVQRYLRRGTLRFHIRPRAGSSASARERISGSVFRTTE